LRAQLATKNKSAAVSTSNNHSVPPMAVSTAPDAPSPSTTSWALQLILVGGVIGLGYFLFRKKIPDPQFQPAGLVNQGGLSGPQTFGSAVSAAPYGQPAYANQSGMQASYGQPAGSGLGGRIVGGVATGLAVGAGVMAAEAIGRNLMGSHNSPAPNAGTDGLANNNFQPIDSNPDMGGAAFGINDTSSWDEAGSIDIGGGGDWDSP
jgi:hypothetical protein